MRYRIKYAPDHLMPADCYWLMTSTSQGVTLFLRRSMVMLDDDERASILEEAWAGYRALLDHEDEPERELLLA